MTTPDEATLLRAIAALEEKLTSLINSSISALNLSIASVQQKHNEELLAQAKLNATFATRDSTERVSDMVNTIRTEHTAIVYRITQLEDRVTKSQALVQQLEEQLAQARSGFLSGVNGVLVNIVSFGGGAVLSFLLNHAVR